MRLTLKTLAFSAALLGGTYSQASAVPIVQDGNFINTLPSFQTYNGGTTLGGPGGAWTVTGHSVDLIGGYWASPTPGVLNSGSVDLDGNGPGGISQQISLAAGSYILSFYLSGNPDGGDPLKVVLAGIPGADQTFSYTTGPGGHNNSRPGGMDYVLETLAFTIATATTTTLSFSSQDTASPYGPVIGGISINPTEAVAPIPEPSTWAMMILGFAALGFAGFRKRKAALSAG